MFATPVRREFLTPHLLYQRYYPHIHNFIISDSDDATVDKIYNKVIELDQQYAHDQTHLQYLFVVDKLSVTPYMLQKLQQALTQMPDDLHESVAIVSDAFIVPIIQKMVIPLMNKHNPNQQAKFCATEAEALNWLQECRNQSHL